MNFWRSKSCRKSTENKSQKCWLLCPQNLVVVKFNEKHQVCGKSVHNIPPIFKPNQRSRLPEKQQTNKWRIPSFSLRRPSWFYGGFTTNVPKQRLADWPNFLSTSVQCCLGWNTVFSVFPCKEKRCLFSEFPSIFWTDTHLNRIFLLVKLWNFNLLWAVICIGNPMPLFITIKRHQWWEGPHQKWERRFCWAHLLPSMEKTRESTCSNVITWRVCNESLQDWNMAWLFHRDLYNGLWHDNAHITGQYNPLHTPNNYGFFIAQLGPTAPLQNALWILPVVCTPADSSS